MRATAEPLTTILNDVAPRIARQTVTPVWVPARLSPLWLRGSSVVVEGQVTADGYMIDVSDGEGCRGSRVCTFAVFEATTGPHTTQGTVPVRLPHGIQAWYGRSVCRRTARFPSSSGAAQKFSTESPCERMVPPHRSARR